jgi:DNA mismatch endonuclease, patch repair protein
MWSPVPITRLRFHLVPREDGEVPAYQSWASSPASRKVMQGNRSRDTSPEIAVRRLLHAAGLRYRVDYRPEPSLRRTADIVFTKQRVAIFIDGCYWHACAQHGTAARSNATYWSEKLQRNVARDADTTARLEAAGWTVLRFWEHEDPIEVASEVTVAVRRLPS